MTSWLVMSSHVDVTLKSQLISERTDEDAVTAGRELVSPGFDGLSGLGVGAGGKSCLHFLDPLGKLIAVNAHDVGKGCRAREG